MSRRWPPHRWRSNHAGDHHGFCSADRGDLRGHLAECQHWGAVAVMDQLGMAGCSPTGGPGASQKRRHSQCQGLAVGGRRPAPACSAQQLEPGWHMRGYCRKCQRVSPSRIGQEYGIKWVGSALFICASCFKKCSKRLGVRQHVDHPRCARPNQGAMNWSQNAAGAFTQP